MRSLGTNGAANFRAAHRKERERIWVADHEDVLQDVTAWVLSWSCGASVEDQAMRAEVVLASSLDGAIPPPFEGSDLPVDIERRLVIETAVVGVGGTIGSGDWQELFRGATDDITGSADGSRITLPCRGLWGRLMDEWIEGEFSTTTGAVEDAMQEILDERYGEGEIPVIVVGDPDTGVLAQDWADIKVADALTKLADLHGAEVRYMWNNALSRWDVTYFLPPDPVTTAFTFAPGDYFAIGDIGLYTTERRRVVRVVYSFAGGTGFGEAVDETYVEGERRTVMWLDARGDPQITSEADAQALAEAVGRVVFLPPFRKTVRGRHFPWLALHDYVRYSGNLVHYLGNQDMAVVSYRHFRDEAGAEGPPPILTEMSLYKRPHGAVGRWFVRAERDALLANVFIPPADIDVPLTALLLYTTKSGTAGYSLESDREGSLGKYASTSPLPGGISSIFRPVTIAEQGAGITLYSCIAVANLAALPWEDVTGWLEPPEPGGPTGVAFAMGLDPVGVVELDDTTAQGAEIADEETAPTGVTFSTPENKEEGLYIGDIAPDHVQLVWLRMIVSADADTQTTGWGGPCFQSCEPEE
jgi:hypothetical protein